MGLEGLSEAERSEALGLAYDADIVIEWLVASSPLAYSTEQAARMRRGGRRLFRDIDGEGIELLGPGVVLQAHGQPRSEGTA